MLPHRKMLSSAAVLGCGLATALAAHAVFLRLASGSAAGSAYLRHGHAALVPALLSASVCATGALFFYLLQLQQIRTRESIIAFAGDFSRSGALLPFAAITLCAIVSLCGMEALERAIAGDRVDGWFSAFGAWPLAGVLVIAALAMAITFALRLFAAWIANASSSLVALLEFIFGPGSDPSNAHGYCSRSAFVSAPYRGEAPHIRGLRAPPVLA